MNYYEYCLNLDESLKTSILAHKYTHDLNKRRKEAFKIGTYKHKMEAKKENSLARKLAKDHNYFTDEDEDNPSEDRRKFNDAIESRNKHIALSRQKYNKLDKKAYYNKIKNRLDREEEIKKRRRQIERDLNRY